MNIYHSIGLRHHPDPSCLFQVLPVRSFEHKGQFLRSDSLFLLYNVVHRAHLANSPSQSLATARKLPLPLYNYCRADHEEPLSRSFSKRKSILCNVYELQQEEQGGKQQKYPLFQEVENYVVVSLENKNQLVWRTHLKVIRREEYVEEGEYICLESTNKGQGMLSLNDNNHYQEYVRVENGEIPLNTVFVVERNQQSRLYLKHILSGKYFPPTKNNKHSPMTLKPRTTLQRRKVPFFLYFSDVLYEFGQKPSTFDQHCFWVRRVDNLAINQILSMRGVSSDAWLHYFNDDFGSCRQKLFYQFKFLHYIVEREISNIKKYPQMKNTKGDKLNLCYKLIFRICMDNNKIQTAACPLLLNLIREEQKEQVAEILTEVFYSQESISKGHITPAYIIYLLKDLKERENYSVPHIRLLRLFSCLKGIPQPQHQNIVYKALFDPKFNNYSQFIDIPPRFMFEINQQYDKLEISNHQQSKCFGAYDPQTQKYIRQYFYLLGDVIHNNNAIIKQFQRKYSIQFLLKMTHAQQQSDLKGPLIKLINKGYLQQQTTTKLFIYYLGYQQNIKLSTPLNCQHLLKLINAQIEMTINLKNLILFRHLLKTIKRTVEIGLWDNIESILQLGRKVDKFNDYQCCQSTKMNFNQLSERRNYISCKIKIVDLNLLLLDLQMDFWIKHLLSAAVQSLAEPTDQLLQNWDVNAFNFATHATDNPILLTRSMKLYSKVYHLKQTLIREYWYARRQRALISPYSLIKIDDMNKLVQTVHNDVVSHTIKDQAMKQLVVALVPQLDIRYMEEGRILGEKESLQPIFKYYKANEEMQFYAWKTNMLEKLCSRIEKGGRTMDLLLILAIVRNNQERTKEIEGKRHMLFKFLFVDGPEYYIAADIITEVYRNNRKLILADEREIQFICTEIKKLIRIHKEDIEKILLKVCRLMYLLEIFTKIGEKRIKKHYFILVRQLLNGRNLLPSLREEQCESNIATLYTLLRYKLYTTLEQSPQNLLQIDTFCSFVNEIGCKNWDLTFQFLCMLLQHSKNLTIQKQQSIQKLLIFTLQTIKQLLNKYFLQKSNQLQIKVIVSQFQLIARSIVNFISKKLKQKPYLQIQRIQILLVLYSLRGIYSEHTFSKVNDSCKQLIKVLSRQHPSLLKSTQQTIQQSNIIFQRRKSYINPTINIQDETQSPHAISTNRRQHFFQQIKLYSNSILKVNSVLPLAIQDSYKQFYLSFLNESFPPPPDKTQLGTNSLYLHNLQSLQSKFVDASTPQLLASFLQESFQERYKLFNHVFMLGINLLEGGHKGCQRVFLRIFQEDCGNCILQNIYKVIESCVSTLAFHYEVKHSTPQLQIFAFRQLEERIDEETKYASEVLIHAFRFLQLLCENDNHEMKAYVFSQVLIDKKVKESSVNFIQAANSALDNLIRLIQIQFRYLERDKHFVRELQRKLLDIPSAILDFLIQVCQLPAFNNQLYMCQSDFFQILSHLKILYKEAELLENSTYIQLGQIELKQPKSILFQLERKLIILFRSLLQGQNPQIIEILSKRISKQQFVFLLSKSLAQQGISDQQRLHRLLKCQTLSPCLQNIIDVLIVYKCLFKKQYQPQNFSSQHISLLSQLDNRLRSIEIVFNQSLITVYFSYHPVFQHLNSQSKRTFLEKYIAYDTREQKLIQLIQSRKYIYESIKKQQDNRYLVCTRTTNHLFTATLSVAYLIVILLCLFYTVAENGVTLDQVQSIYISNLVALQTVLANAYALFWFINKLLREKDHVEEKSKSAQTGRHKHKIWIIINTITELHIEDQQFVRVLITLIITFAAYFIQIRLNSLTLLYIFTKAQMLKSIWQSIKLTWKQLIAFCILALAFSFIFGFLTLNYYLQQLYDHQRVDIALNSQQAYCNSILNCINTLYTQKIIGDSIDRHSNQYGRFVSDGVHSVFFEIFFANIIAAIIIDKFAEQRHIREKIQKEKNNSCLICSTDKSRLQVNGIQYLSHIKQVHNIWNYFFYMYYLEKLKTNTEFTGIEYWVVTQIKEGRTKWIPYEKITLDNCLEKQSGY